jgi:hypothetical protein
MANFRHCGTSKFFAKGCRAGGFGNLPRVDVKGGVVSKDGDGVSIAHWASVDEV